MKFEDQFCGLFGVAMKDGKGIVLPKYYYSDCNVNSIKTHKSNLNKMWAFICENKKEFGKQNDLGFDLEARMQDPQGTDHSEDVILAFKARYGTGNNRWWDQLHARKELTRERDIRELIDHMFMTADDVYKNDGGGR